MHPRDATPSREGQNATAAEPLGTIFRSDAPISIEVRPPCTKRGAFALGEDVLTGLSFPFALHQDSETEKLPMTARRDVDWPEFHLVADRGPHESDA